MMNKHEEALRAIADIAEGSTTANSLPHIAKIAREALAAPALPTTEDVLAAIDSLPSEWSPEAGPHEGLKHVSWRALAYALFPKGSPLWRRPKDQPHGLDQSPAYAFMDRLGSDPRVKKVNTRQTSYYARMPQ